MKHWKIVWLLATISLFGLLFQSCNDDDDEKEDTTPYIGVLLSNQNNAWHRATKQYAENALDQNRIKYYTLSIASNATQQINQIDEAIEKGAKVLIISLESPKQATYSKIKEVIKNGTKVIFLEDEKVIDNYTAKVYVDNREVGALVAEYINTASQFLDVRTVAVFEAINDHTGRGDDRLTGFTERLTSINTKVTINSAPLSAYTREAGREAAIALLGSTALVAAPPIDAIYALDDEVALGVMDAIASINRVNEVKVLVGCGGEATFMNKIKAYDLMHLATVMYSPDMITKCIDLAIKLVDKKSVTKDNQIVLDAIVSSSNVDSYTPAYSIYGED